MQSGSQRRSGGGSESGSQRRSGGGSEIGQPAAPRFMPQDDEVELKPLLLWHDDSGTLQTMPCTEALF